MNHPLENYRIIADSRYILEVEDNLYIQRYSEICHNGGDFEVTRERENDRLKIVGIDIWGEGFIGYETLTSFFLSEYNKLQEEARLEIDKFMLLHLEEKEQSIFIKNVLAELQVLQNAIAKLMVHPKYETYKSILIDKSYSFSSLLKDIYQNQKNEVRTVIPKIQWLAETNLLTTLFYDLLNGQKKATKGAINTKPFIKAKAADIERLLVENFLDSDGKPLKPETIKTYLNKSRPETRVKEGGRIELSL